MKFHKNSFGSPVSGMEREFHFLPLMLLFLVALAVFFFDLSLPLGVAGGTPYVAIVLLGYWYPGIRLIWASAILASCLMTAGYFLSPAGGVPWVVITNRLLALFVIWVPALLLVVTKRAGESTRITQAKFRNLVEGSIQGIWIFRDWELLFCNRAFAEIFGYGGFEEFLIRGSIKKLIAEQEIPKIIGMMEALESGEIAPGKIVFEGISKDGSRIWLENIVRVVEWDGQKAIQASTVDITAARETEEELRKSEEWFRKIFEEGPIGMAFFDSDFYIKRSNSTFRRMLGYTESELTGLTFQDITHPEDLEKDVVPAAEMFNGERTSFQIEKRYLKKNGEILQGNLTAALFRDDAGRPLYGLGMVEDITLRKEREAELLKAKETAEEATRLKDKFVSLVAHDLRSPLVASIGLLQMGLCDESESTPAEQRELMKTVSNRLQGLAELINGILEISLLQTGRIQLRKREFDAYEMLAGALFLQHLATKKGVKIQNEVPPFHKFHGDPTLLSEVIQNLVSNAIKFSNSGDTVTISLRSEEPTVIAVADTGVGIPPETIPLLFRHEERTSTKGTAGENGHGLGLPLSHDIMKAHGGLLSVESKVGSGTTFLAEFTS